MHMCIYFSNWRFILPVLIYIYIYIYVFLVKDKKTTRPKYLHRGGVCRRHSGLFLDENRERCILCINFIYKYIYMENI